MDCDNTSSHFKCDFCKSDIEGKFNELILDGTDDIYNLVLCDKCYELLSSDYYSLEDVDKMFK